MSSDLVSQLLLNTLGHGFFRMQLLMRLRSMLWYCNTSVLMDCK